ncbi:MAG: DsbA family protein [Rhodospirillales bacterium]
MKLLRLLAAAGFALLLAAPLVPANADELTEGQREEVGKLVEKYILDNPEIIMQAIEKLRERQRLAEEEQRRAAMASLGDDLRSDPLTPPGGNPDGKVVVVEFFDYNCGYCKRVSPTVAQLLEANGDVKLVYKEFPVLGESSLQAARAALASVKQGKYIEMHETMMNHRGRVGEAVIFAAAAQHGLDVEQLRKDMDSQEVTEAIERTYAVAQSLGIEGTPAFLIGKKLVPGAVSLETLQQLVDEARSGS